MKYTFQHYLDISTSAESLTMIQISAGGRYTMERIKHLLGAFKYIKYGRISIKLLPASTLPVDPLGLSYTSDDPQTVDPRDQMNPGLVRITNGEDIFTDFAGLSDTAQEQMYINTMLDPRWSKFMLQSGFKRSAVPLYYNVGSLAQNPYMGSIINIPSSNSPTSTHVESVTHTQLHDNAYSGSNLGSSNVVGSFGRTDSDPRGLFQTGHRGRMGWMPTDAFFNFDSKDPANTDMVTTLNPMFNPLPEIQCITCILPKAHKTKYYYRMFITETVYLSGIKNSGINGEDSDGVYREYRAVDNFVMVDTPQPRSPASGFLVSSRDPLPPNDGGGPL